MQKNNGPYYVYIKNKKIVSTQKKPAKIEPAVFPTKEAADKYMQWLGNKTIKETK